MRSKRLRTTEEPVDLDGTSALKSKRKSSAGPPSPKVRRSVAGTTGKKEKKKEAESKHNQSQNSVQLSGKKLTDDKEDI